MSGDHVTVRIPKRAFRAAGVLLVAGGAFWAGTVISDDAGRVGGVATTTTTATATSTTLAIATTTTEKPAPKPATKPPVLAASIMVKDDCPVAAQVQGTLTVTWTTSAAVDVEVRLMHGADMLIDPTEDVAKSATKTFRRPCNGAVGSTVTYSVMAVGADGKTVSDRGETRM